MEQTCEQQEALQISLATIQNSKTVEKQCEGLHMLYHCFALPMHNCPKQLKGRRLLSCEWKGYCKAGPPEARLSVKCKLLQNVQQEPAVRLKFRLHYCTREQGPAGTFITPCTDIQSLE